MKNFPVGLPGLLVAALIFGVLGDLLMREAVPPGANLALWSFATLGLVLWSRLPNPAMRVPLVAAAFFSILLAWREAEPLKLLLIAVICGSVALTTAAAIGRSPRVAFVWDYFLDGLNFALSTLALPFTLLGHAQESGRTNGRFLPPYWIAVLRGLLIAAPLLFVFGSLLVSADVLFEKLVLSAFDIETFVSHVALIVIFGWGAATTWWLCLEGSPRVPVPRSDPDRPFRWGAIEINVAFGLVAALFLVFLAVQVRYFFGGHRHVLEAEGLTYADYARTGFFELAMVAAIALALLVNCSRLVSSASAPGKRAFKAITAILIACVLCLIASAFHRMTLYIDAYGLTRMRLYVACFLIWMIVVFLWLYFTIYAERIRGFAWGFLLSGYAATFILIAINPDAQVARVNLSRAIEMRTTPNADALVVGLDTSYLEVLSADAVPTIVRALPDVDTENRNRLRGLLSQRTERYAERPLRTWTLSLHQANSALQRVEITPENVSQ